MTDTEIKDEENSPAEQEAATVEHEAKPTPETPAEGASDASPKAPFSIGPTALVAMCLGSGLVGGLTVLVGLSVLGIGGSTAPGSQAQNLYQLGIAPQPILPSASDIRSNAMTGQPMRGPWPAAEFRAPVAGEAITPQSALPRSIGSLDAVSDALEQAARKGRSTQSAE